jgi:hypothetical protein
MKKSVYSISLLYRGTDCNEWTDKGVHRRIDNRGPTVSLMKIAQTGRRCGGFTSVPWDSTTGCCKYDKYAFLFSLDKNTHYPVIDKSKAIYCHSGRGIMFG